MPIKETRRDRASMRPRLGQRHLRIPLFHSRTEREIIYAASGLAVKHKIHGRRVDVSATASYLPGVVIWRSSGPFVEKSPNRIAMLQLEASQSRRVTTYRVTFELFIPQMASILAFFSRLF
jgi:hypothetical protein